MENQYFMNINLINNYIDKLHFRTYNHIYDKVKEKFPNIKKNELKSIIDNRLKDKFIKVKKI